MRVYVSATLRSFFDRNDTVEVAGNNIRSVLDGLVDEYPDVKKGLFDENGNLREFIHIYVDDEDYTSKELWEKTFHEDTEIILIPSIAGGEKSRGNGIISDDRRKEIVLDDKEVERYSKHLMLRDISVKGQKKIKAARVVILGAGALGSPVIQYLAAAGVGTIKVVDFDEVSIENLQSQVIHTTRDLHRPKVASARDTIRNINRDILVETENIKIEANNIEELIEGFDVVVDCTDNYKSRYLIGDACGLHKIPLVFAAIYQFEGQVGIFNFNDGPCFRCQFPAPPPAGLVPTCSEGGTLSSLPGIIGSIQATEVLKLIIGIGENLSGKLLVIDSLYLHSGIFKVNKKENCPICGSHPSIFAVEDFDYEDFCGLKQNDEEVPVEGIEADELARRIENGEPLTIVDVREPHERAIHRFPDAIVIPIGQLARRQKELNPDVDTIFICKEGKRSILAINTLREAGYKGPMYNLKGGIDAAKNIIFSHEGAWL
ncbi:MAG: molybdopterin-synthase adenylyltransferase MoeB [Lachnospiraceae bacterium]